jgi:hypothetical protein
MRPKRGTHDAAMTIVRNPVRDPLRLMLVCHQNASQARRHFRRRPAIAGGGRIVASGGYVDTRTVLSLSQRLDEILGDREQETDKQEPS